MHQWIVTHFARLPDWVATPVIGLVALDTHDWRWGWTWLDRTPGTRTPDGRSAISKDWRAAEAELPRLTGRIPSPEVTARVDSVRAEHAAALDREIDHARSVEERARRDQALLYPF
jgi:hypothetical protein